MKYLLLRRGAVSLDSFDMVDKEVVRLIDEQAGDNDDDDHKQLRPHAPKQRDNNTWKRFVRLFNTNGDSSDIDNWFELLLVGYLLLKKINCF